MEGFDDPGVFFSDNFSDATQGDGSINNVAIKKKFIKFIKEFQEGNFAYKYRDGLKRNYLRRDYSLEVSFEDLAGFDEHLADKLRQAPALMLALLEEAAKEAADEITSPRPAEESRVEDIHVSLCSEAAPTSARDLKSDQVSKLVKIPGIVVAASGVKAKATHISIQCRTCRTTIPDIQIKAGFEGYQLPRKCNVEQAGRPACPLDPFFILPDNCKCVDFQNLKLQEAPESVPHGELPRHIQMYVDRSLVDRAVPGNRVTVIGVYSIRKMAKIGQRRELLV